MVDIFRDCLVIRESKSFPVLIIVGGEPTYPFRDSCYLYVLIHLLEESHYSKRWSRTFLINRLLHLEYRGIPI